MGNEVTSTRRSLRVGKDYRRKPRCEMTQKQQHVRDGDGRNEFSGRRNPLRLELYHVLRGLMRPGLHSTEIVGVDGAIHWRQSTYVS